jgi:transposase
MWEPYLKVIREKCSQALHILDRCHIVAKMNTALDEVRAGESRRMANEGRSPLLKKSRWLLLKREETQDRTALPSRNARICSRLSFSLSSMRIHADDQYPACGIFPSGSSCMRQD